MLHIDNRQSGASVSVCHVNLLSCIDSVYLSCRHLVRQWGRSISATIMNMWNGSDGLRKVLECVVIQSVIPIGINPLLLSDINNHPVAVLTPTPPQPPSKFSYFIQNRTKTTCWKRYSPVLPWTGCVKRVSVCMLECVRVCCYSVCENLLATVRISWSRGARKTHPTSTLWVNTSLRGRTTDWVGVSRRGVKTTMSKFLHTDLVN